MRRSVGVLVVALLFAQPAHATEFYSGKEILDRCIDGLGESGAQVFKADQQGLCLGYIAGVVGAVDFPLPKSVTLGQVQLIVVKYLREHPERLHLSASDLVQESLKKAFSPGAKE